MPVAELLGWLLAASYQAVAMALRGVSADLRTQLYAFGHMALAGMVVWASGRVWSRFGRESLWLRALLFTLLVAPLLRVVLEADLEGPVGRSSPFVPEVSYWIVALLAALVWALGREMVGTWFALGWLRLGPLLIAAPIGLLNAWIAPLSYAGVHLFVAASVALVSGAALHGIALPLRLSASRFASAALVALGVLSALSVFVTPSNGVLIMLERQPGAVWAPFLGPIWTKMQPRSRSAQGKGEWFRPRSAAASVPPSPARVSRENLIVLLLGVDSMRANVLEDEKLQQQLPEFFRLRDEGVWFRQARSPGASTATTIGPMFAGKPYSALYWSRHVERQPDVFPHEDETPRFPELLTAAGVITFNVDTTGWLNDHFALVRGFTRQVDGRRKTKSQGPSSYPSAKRAGEHLRKRLKKEKKGPFFAYLHFMDAHSPYTSAGKAKTPYAGYLKELALVDEELGRLRVLLEERGLARRTITIVYADHGEAFGEHDLKWHASSLYDPMIKVPLLISGPGISSSVIEEPVSLLDLYPTILDLYGLSTPGHVLGESLVPLLAGGHEPLTRPIVSEARLKQALVSQDLWKVIQDPRSGAVEVYDLNRDPGEEKNLYAPDDARSEELLGLLGAYFDAHELKRHGYTTPYRKW
jgi:hypothetical protein